MNIKTTLSKAEYNKETGESYVSIMTDLGEFAATAKLHPDDAEIASSYAGCRYAEKRATIKYLKEKIKIVGYKLNELYKIYKEINQKNNCNKDNFGMRILEKEIYLLEDEKLILYNTMQSIETSLKKEINERPKIIKHIIEQTKDKENK